MALDGLQPRDVGFSPLASADTDEVVLQRVLWDRPPPVRALYWRTPPMRAKRPGDVSLQPGGALRIERHGVVSFDTYFGAVFERPWQLYTMAGPLTLSVWLQGQAFLRVFRQVPGQAPVLQREQDLDGPAQLSLPPTALHHRQAGLLWFELTAGKGGAVLQRAEWSTPAPAARASLAVVICTFDRQGPLGAVLSALAGDPGLDTAIARVIVVNQGTPGLRQHAEIADAAAMLADRLLIVEQANLGGAGGFGRGMLEALDDDAATHICLLDDDVRIEPESLRRMAVFFSLATGAAPVALGGHMLDAIQHTTLYEAGAIVRPNWSLQPLNHLMKLHNRERLPELLETVPMHYNGWWMFGFDKRLIDRVGMPLPCFIRGDDVEFGVRLGRQGVPTVALPGVAIWHEPFYLKLGSWQLYYETRNALVAAALHQPFPRRQAAVQMMKQVLLHLLTYRYYNAALIVRAVRDFRTGPAILDQDPRSVHAQLAPLRAHWPQAATRREQVLLKARVASSPRRRLGFAVALLLAAARNWLRPSRPDTPPRHLLVRDLVWFRVIHEECLAVDTYWDRDLPTYRRDRAAFRELLREGLREAWLLWRSPALRDQWRAGIPRLTSVAFWRDYVRRF